MATVDQSMIEEVRDRLVAELQPERIVLFGSQSDGTAGPSSDLDVFVIVSDSDLSPARRAARAHRSLRGLGVPTDILVRTRAEFERYRDVPTSLEWRVDRRGRVIYG